MAEGCAFLCSKMLLSNVDCLYDKVEEISALKNLLELAFAGKRNLRVGFGSHLFAEHGNAVIIYREHDIKWKSSKIE